MRKNKGTLRRRPTASTSTKPRAVPAEGGVLEIFDISLAPLTPLPSSWIMMKSGDFLVSQSGTIRVLLRKVWEAGHADCLRLKCENVKGQVTASLDVEKMELNSSNFENLLTVIRDIALHPTNKMEINPVHLNKTVRFNILTLLGFGKIGSQLHVLIPSIGSQAPRSVVKIGMQVDSSNGQFLDFSDRDLSPDKSPLPTSRKPFIELELHWMRDESNKIFRLTGFAYAPGTSAQVLECVTLASELANRISTVSSLIGTLLPAREN